MQKNCIYLNHKNMNYISIFGGLFLYLRLSVKIFPLFTIKSIKKPTPISTPRKIRPILLM